MKGGWVGGCVGAIDDSDSVSTSERRIRIAKGMPGSDSYRTSLSVRTNHSACGGERVVEERICEECQVDERVKVRVDMGTGGIGSDGGSRALGTEVWGLT